MIEIRRILALACLLPQVVSAGAMIYWRNFASPNSSIYRASVDGSNAVVKMQILSMRGILQVKVEPGKGASHCLLPCLMPTLCVLTVARKVILPGNVPTRRKRDKGARAKETQKEVVRVKVEMVMT